MEIKNGDKFLIEEVRQAEVKHYQINGKYKIQFEVGATKGVTGWKIEASGDDIDVVKIDALSLKGWAEVHTAGNNLKEVKIE